MKKIGILAIFILALSGCAHTQYKAPDGTEVSYTRLFTTSDSIKAEVGAAKIESNGQKVDAEIVKALTNLVNAARGL